MFGRPNLALNLSKITGVLERKGGKDPTVGNFLHSHAICIYTTARKHHWECIKMEKKGSGGITEVNQIEKNWRGGFEISIAKLVDYSPPTSRNPESKRRGVRKETHHLVRESQRP